MGCLANYIISGWGLRDSSTLQFHPSARPFAISPCPSPLPSPCIGDPSHDGSSQVTAAEACLLMDALQSARNPLHFALSPRAPPPPPPSQLTLPFAHDLFLLTWAIAGGVPLTYAVRPMLLEGCPQLGPCSLLGTGERLHLAGYGVEMAIKNMEYSALDDSQVQCLNT